MPITNLPHPNRPASEAGSSEAAGDRNLGRSIAWTGLAKAIAQGFSWVATLLVARFLSPRDYGLYGMASLFFWAIQALGEFGIGAAIIGRRALTAEKTSHLNGLSVLFGLACAAVVMASAGPLSVFFSAPDLFEVILVTALVFPITSLRTVPAALLQRDLRFRVLGAVDVWQAAVSAGALLGFALLGWGYWSLVLANVVGAAFGTTALLAIRNHPMRFPRSHVIGDLTTFGREVVASRFGWYAMFNADFLVAGRALGAVPLGNYSLAWSLASLPVEKISLVVTRVALPYLATAASRVGGLRDHMIGMTRGLALLTFPAAVGIGLVADLLIRVVLGSKWEAAVLPLRILALAVPIRSIATLFPQLTTALGRTRFGMYHAALSAVVMLAGFVIGSRYGPVGIAAAWATVYPLVLLPLVVVNLRAIDCSAAQYFGALTGAARATVAMTLAVLTTRGFMPDSWPDAGRLVTLIVVGAVGYGGWLWAVEREQVKASYRFLTLGRSHP